MKGNILSTLGVFTTFCQPVSSCVYGTSLLPLAEGGLEGFQFGLTYPVELLEWSQTISTADGSKVDNLGVLVHETMETLAKSNAVTEFNIGASSEHRVAREYFSVPSNYDFDTTAVASPTSFDRAYSTQVLNAIPDAASHIADFGQTVATTSDRLSFTSPVARMSNSPVMSYRGSLTIPSCSEGVIDRTATVAPIANVDAAKDAASEVMRSNSLYIQGKLGKPSLLSWAAKAALKRAAAP